jgi:hypothetical protein
MMFKVNGCLWEFPRNNMRFLFEGRMAIFLREQLLDIRKQRGISSEISGLGLHLRAGSDDKIFKTFGMANSGHHWGHCDLICGKHAPEVTWPYILNWLNEKL